MSFDISTVTAGWEFRPNEITVRKIVGQDGRWKIQLRLDLGILQMELYGRPDGARPHGYESLLEYYKGKLRRHLLKHGSDEKFKLEPADCAALQREGIQYYHRYLSLFQLKDYVHVEKDTQRNIEVIDMVKQYAADEKDSWTFEQYRPYVLMMNTRAQASMSLKKKNYTQALIDVKEGIHSIEQFFQGYGQSHIAEESIEIKFLQNWLKEIRERRPLSPVEKLKKKLDRAIKNEEYEEAAVLRDKLNTLREN